MEINNLFVVSLEFPYQFHPCAVKELYRVSVHQSFYNLEKKDRGLRPILYLERSHSSAE